MPAVTRGMAKEITREPLEFNLLDTAEDTPGAGLPGGPQIYVAWQVASDGPGEAWVSVVPVRYAKSPVLLLAVPAEVVDVDTVPLSPSGKPSGGDVAVQTLGSRRATAKVVFLALTEEAFGQEYFCNLEAIENAGIRLRGFGPQGTALPKP